MLYRGGGGGGGGWGSWSLYQGLQDTTAIKILLYFIEKDENILELLAFII